MSKREIYEARTEELLTPIVEEYGCRICKGRRDLVFKVLY